MAIQAPLHLALQRQPMKNCSAHSSVRMCGRAWASAVIIAGDLNVDVQDSPVLMSALGTGHVFDAIRWAAESQPLPNRLDHILLNRHAFCSLLHAGNFSGEHGFPVHTPVFADLRCV